MADSLAWLKDGFGAGVKSRKNERRNRYVIIIIMVLCKIIIMNIKGEDVTMMPAGICLHEYVRIYTQDEEDGSITDLC